MVIFIQNVYINRSNMYLIAMKGYIFNTEFYTKIDWHSGKIILSRNGQTKGYGEPGSAKYQARTGFGRTASGLFGNPQARAHVTVNGKKMIMLNLMVGQALAGQDYGGRANKETERNMKHQAAVGRLQGVTGYAFRQGMNPNLGMAPMAGF